VVRSVTSKRSCVRRWNLVSTTASAQTSIRARTGAIALSDIRDRRATKVRIDRGRKFLIFVFLTRNFFAEVVLDITANFSGNSYLQLENSLLDRNKREHSISMTFTTDSANGLLYWQGQEPNNDGVVDNYIAISSEPITVNYINNKSLQIQFNISIFFYIISINFRLNKSCLVLQSSTATWNWVTGSKADRHQQSEPQTITSTTTNPTWYWSAETGPNGLWNWIGQPQNTVKNATWTSNSSWNPPIWYI